MSWEQTSPSHFERPLDLLEKFFVAIGTPTAASKKEPFSINLVVNVKLDNSLGDPLTALRRAWADVRLRFPEIASTQDGIKKHYDVLKDEAALQAWVEATCFLELSRSVQDTMRSFEAGERTTLRYFRATGELLLHCPHYLIDGLACIFLLDHIFTAMTSGSATTVTPGHEHANLQPSVEQVTGITQTTEINEESMRLFLSMAGQMPSVSMPPSAPQNAKTATTYASVRLSRTTTASLIAACKKANVGITAAMHAALIKAVGMYDASKKYVSVLRVNMRPYLPAPYDSNAYPLNPCVSGTPAALVTTDPFERLSTEMQRIYTDRVLMSNVLRYLKGWVYTLLSNPPPPGAPAPANPDFNSLGLIDRILKREYGDGAIQVLDFWHGSEQINSNQEIYMWTFHDQLNLLACFNEALYTSNSMQAYLEEVVDLLCTGLGVTRS